MEKLYLLTFFQCLDVPCILFETFLKYILELKFYNHNQIKTPQNILKQYNMDTSGETASASDPKSDDASVNANAQPNPGSSNYAASLTAANSAFMHRLDKENRDREKLYNQLLEEKDKLNKEKDKRIEEMDKRIEEKDKRIEEMAKHKQNEIDLTVANTELLSLKKKLSVRGAIDFFEEQRARLNPNQAKQLSRESKWKQFYQTDVKGLQANLQEKFPLLRTKTNADQEEFVANLFKDTYKIATAYHHQFNLDEGIHISINIYPKDEVLFLLTLCDCIPCKYTIYINDQIVSIEQLYAHYKKLGM